MFDRTSQALTNLGGLSERPASEAYASNAGGLVVGRAYHPLEPGGWEGARAFLWQHGALTALNDLLPPGSGWDLTAAFGINDAGQIVGAGTRNGRQQAVLLTPVGR